MRIANKSLKEAIVKFENLSSINDVYTLRDAARRFGVARNTIARWSDLGLFKAKRFNFCNKSYRYYTCDQCEMFEHSDFYKQLPRDDSKIYEKISMTIHDFNIGSNDDVFTPLELANKLGVSVQTVNRLDKSGVFVANRVIKNNRTYRYYTVDQYNLFVESDVYKNLNVVKNSDIIGRKIGKLKILSYSNSAIKKGYYGSYICECDCGNIIELSRSEILSDKIKSCGCKFHDLTGKTFGLWHVDSQADCSFTTNDQKVFRYNCTCACGKKSVVYASSLRSGRSQSCGCHKEPLGELHIREYLHSIGLFPLCDDMTDGYVQHKTYSDLLGVNGGLLSYDFYVLLNGKEWLLEYQGKQHYEAIEYFGGNEKFLIQQEHDLRKRKYSFDIGVRLVEIPYKCMIYDDIAMFLKNVGIS